MYGQLQGNKFAYLNIHIYININIYYLYLCIYIYNHMYGPVSPRPLPPMGMGVQCWFLWFPPSPPVACGGGVVVGCMYT